MKLQPAVLAAVRGCSGGRTLIGGSKDEGPTGALQIQQRVLISDSRQNGDDIPNRDVV